MSIKLKKKQPPCLSEKSGFFSKNRGRIKFLARNSQVFFCQIQGDFWKIRYLFLKNSRSKLNNLGFWQYGQFYFIFLHTFWTQFIIFLTTFSRFLQSPLCHTVMIKRLIMTVIHHDSSKSKEKGVKNMKNYAREMCKKCQQICTMNVCRFSWFYYNLH